MNDFQPFMRVVQNLTKSYLGMARSRDVAQRNLRSNKEHLSHVTSDRDSANARVIELEARVANLEKELTTSKKETTAAVTKAKDALAKEQAALKQEEELTPRVQAIVNSLTEVLGSPPDLTDRVWVNALVDSVTLTEDQVSKTRTMFGKFHRLLKEFFRTMFPESEEPTSTEGLLNASMGTPALVDFSRAQTLSGAEVVLTLTGAHGVEADYDTVFSKVHVDADGNEVDLEPFAVAAVPLADKLLKFIEVRDKELAELEAHEAAAETVAE